MGRQLQAHCESLDSLGCGRAAGSSVTDVQGASLLPVLGEGGAHVALQPLDGPDHQVVHWNRGTRETVSAVSPTDSWRRHPAAPVVSLTFDFPDGLPGIPAHDGKRDQPDVLAALPEGGGEEAGCAHVAWVCVALDDVFAQVLLEVDLRATFNHGN